LLPFSPEKVLCSRLLYRNVKVKLYSTIILPVVLYGCETWSLTLREEYRLRVFENRVIRRIFEMFLCEKDSVLLQRFIDSNFVISLHTVL
jgi:hypothetical protein